MKLWICNPKYYPTLFDQRVHSRCRYDSRDLMYITFTASPGDIYPPQQTFSAFSHLHRAFADCSLQQFLLLLYCTVFRQWYHFMYSACNISFKPAAHFLSVCGLFKDFDWYSGKNRTYHEYFPIFLIYHFCRCGCTVTCIGLQFLPGQLRCMAW